jgi:hypothetical protein
MLTLFHAYCEVSTTLIRRTYVRVEIPQAAVVPPARNVTFIRGAAGAEGLISQGQVANLRFLLDLTSRWRFGTAQAPM